LGKPEIAAGRLDPWRAEIRALAALPNTACKLSGMVTEADPATWTVDTLRPYADTVLDAFGPERVLFGSDWPVCTLAATYGQVVDAAAELVGGRDESVFAGTAERIYFSRVGARNSRT
jgi:L-fuconolactonase